MGNNRYFATKDGIIFYGNEKNGIEEVKTYMKNGKIFNDYRKDE